MSAGASPASPTIVAIRLPSAPNTSVAIASAASRSGASQISSVRPVPINALPSAHRMSLRAQHTTTPITRSGARAASASAYAPPVETPTATNRSMPKWSATANPSGAHSAMVRPGRVVDRP